jgi:hypothetical protein
MTQARINASYSENLLLNELDSLTTVTHLPIKNNDVSKKLSFDDRVEFFKQLSQSILFQNNAILTDDIEFWFPECAPRFKHDIKKVISKKSVAMSLEFVIAELMDQ